MRRNSKPATLRDLSALRRECFIRRTRYSIIVYIRAKIWEKQIGNIASEMVVDIANPWSTTNILKHASVALKASPYEGIDLRQKAAS